MKICEYGCGLEAGYQFKNGKWCCSKTCNTCPGVRKKVSEAHMEKTQSKETKMKISKTMIGKNKGPRTSETKMKISKSMMGKNKGKVLGHRTSETKKKISKSNKLTIEQIKERYPLFSKIEEMRYNPVNPNKKEIQVHCKNHECINSKERGGWFTPSYYTFKNRTWAIEKPDGNDGHYFYCCQECKDSCPLYGVKSDPLKENTLPYTSAEHAEFIRQTLIVKDKEICHYCGGKANIVHHTRPVKLEPFFALDAEYAISVCQSCHYKYGHKTGTECSTANLANVTCNPESQKFLNQK